MGAKKVRRLGEGRAIGGFAGSAADGLALFERLEDKLAGQRSPLRRAAVELAKEWRGGSAPPPRRAVAVGGRAGGALLPPRGGGAVRAPAAACPRGPRG